MLVRGINSCQRDESQPCEAGQKDEAIYDEDRS